ncbi:MAG: cysteine desulfurase [Proteobacteria bacterium]|nr:cysteine desulfurase [Pseudomonadota bacterium]
MEQRSVYMDNNATTPLHPEVIKTMAEAMSIFGNPSSLHNFGRQGRAMIEDARETVATFIGAEPEEIIFVGSGSEANNTVLSTVTCKFNTCDVLTHGTGIITTTIEHPCIMETAQCLQEQGTPVSFVKVDDQAKIDIEGLQAAFAPNTGLVSVMMANNETGTIQDIKAITDIVHQRGAMMHTDAIQAVGKIPVNVKELGVDFLSLSGHKLYGPKGVGVLYVRKGISFCPLIRGGHQEKGRRAGTENTLGIVGLGKAVEMRMSEMEAEAERLRGLKTMLKKGIEDTIPDIYIVGHQEDCVPNTLNVSFAGAEGEAILLYLDLAGIGVSTGSACASGSLDPSHVLLAMGLEAEQAHGSIRISLGRQNTKEDVEYMIQTLQSTIKRIRDMSTVYGGRN